MNTSDVLIVVGAGTAGAELALAARLHGWAGDIVLFGDEARLPYHRPPLSKAYLSGHTDAGTLPLRAEAAYEKASVTLRTDMHVQSIDRASRRVCLADGSEIAYTSLALCTGGRPRPLALDGFDASAPPPNLHYLRTQSDADALRARLAGGQRLAIVGGGYVGLEVAASARKAGAQVVLIESQPRVLARVTGPELSRFYEEMHAEAGVDIRTSCGIACAECASDGSITALVLADDTRVEIDAVVAGIGMLPNVEMAAAAGLEVDGGILVDEFSCTSDPRIWAAGDCT
ncbi:MAG: FAD-dependent oxidoreductase, partial [Comamonadaceae bacterium]